MKLDINEILEKLAILGLSIALVFGTLYIALLCVGYRDTDTDYVYVGLKVGLWLYVISMGFELVLKKLKSNDEY